jgi:carbon-monoxide dehydrogenase medium subunit
MIPASFDYHRPSSLDEAVGMLTRFGSEAKVLSGGMSLLPLLKLRLGSAAHLVDIGRIPGLEYIKEESGVLKIGGATRECLLERSEIIRAKYPILLDTARVIADPLVRNRATVGGNLAHGDPANDHPATMIALGASVVARGPKGERTIPVNQLYKGLLETALAPDEILVEIRIPTPAARSGGAYLKLERKVGDFAAAAAAVQVTLDAKGAIERAGIGLTNAGPMPVEAANAAKYLIGKTVTQSADDKVVAEAARLAASNSAPSEDRRGSVEYKREMARVMVARALRKAVGRAAGAGG